MTPASTRGAPDRSLRATRLGYAPVARSVAVGMFLMAFFTTFWALWIPYGLPSVVALPLLALFVTLAVGFVVSGIGLVRAGRRFPAVGEDARGRGRRVQKGFAVVVGAEGLVIGVVCAILGARGAFAYFGPAIALVVGLHFLPLGIVFRRTIDYYVGAWVSLAALAGLWLVRAGTLPPSEVGSLVAVATAAGTATYGVYQVRLTRALLSGLGAPDAGNR